ncbi:uncharacterized protein LOC119364949 isoform X2 [Triticum dicoccoides]|uniref:uncharacterized protein LOC119364949 isoform X2 n=1 Tax=Triticum dicoccoides TaxID=85692 RepID=UPI00188DD094|nr:uncharacterized protein LOC119364949 isoform X2 [Triticum dicoccoides]
MTTRKAGARLPGRVHGIHDYWAEGRQGGEGEKKGQRKSGAERRRPELAGAGRWRTGAGDGGKAGARRSRAMADGRGRRRDPVRGLVPTTTAAWPREDSTRRRAGAAQVSCVSPLPPLLLSLSLSLSLSLGALIISPPSFVYRSNHGCSAFKVYKADLEWFPRKLLLFPTSRDVLHLDCFLQWQEGFQGGTESEVQTIQCSSSNTSKED